MSKAIIITRYFKELDKLDKDLLIKSNLFKLCVNNVKFENSNIRLFHDYSNVFYYCYNFPIDTFVTYQQGYKIARQYLYEDRFKLFYNATDKPNTKDKTELFMYNGSIIPSIDYCIKNNYINLLLIANNRAHNENFQKEINFAINKVKPFANIYQCSSGNFELPMKSIRDFIEE